VCRSVCGTLTDQRLFLIAAFFNLTADYVDDRDLIPNEPQLQGRRVACRQPARLPYNDLRLFLSGQVGRWQQG
jgi:hypothetical protein